MKVAVIGLGATGSAALRFLAMDGHVVTGFESETGGHVRGSSHGQSRIIRHAYADRFYAQLMKEAHPLWSSLEEASGEELFVRCGGLTLGPREHPEIAATREALRAEGLHVDEWSAPALAERYPAFALRDTEVALFATTSGFLRASDCVAANLRLATAMGAGVRETTRVARLRDVPDGVVIETDDGEEHFDRAIASAGAWTGKLFAAARLPLEVTHQQVVYLAPERPGATFAPAQFPIWIDAVSNDYGFPEDGRMPGVKVASHSPGPRIDPDTPSRATDLEREAGLIARCRERLPGLTSRVTHAQSCIYTSTPDEDFILDRAPGVPRCTVVSGCSGHGFKFTVLLGKLAAMLATDRAPPTDLQRFSLSRFATR